MYQREKRYKINVKKTLMTALTDISEIKTDQNDLTPSHEETIISQDDSVDSQENIIIEHDCIEKTEKRDDYSRKLKFCCHDRKFGSMYGRCRCKNGDRGGGSSGRKRMDNSGVIKGKNPCCGGSLGRSRYAKYAANNDIFHAYDNSDVDEMSDDE